ncbi:MAG: hypothetical protein WCE75_16765 [Terracidiphilus sp.]
MTEPGWYPFEDGKTLGQTGSEEGVILRDEEHILGARITLERGGRIVPFAITCGIYGWMLHTRFFEAEAEATDEYDRMRAALAGLLEAAEQAGDGGGSILMDGVAAFVDSFP